MRTETQIRGLTTQQAVDLLTQRSNELGVPPSKANPEEILEQVCEEAYEELARDGLIHLAGTEHSQSRSGGFEKWSERDGPIKSPNSGRTQQPGPGTLMEHKKVAALRRVQLVTADGDRLLPLEYMPVKEQKAASTRHRTRGLNELKKADFLDLSAETCRSHNVDIPADLPEEVWWELNSKAEEAWT